MSDFSPEENKRYSRHYVLPGFGKEGQVQIKSGSVLVVGAAIGRISIGEVLKTIWPFYLAVLAVLLVVAFVPELSLWLPSVLK